VKTAYRHIGRDVPRPDTPDKAAGKAQYIHDLTRPGMLAGKIKFSEHAHARILSIDTSRAERLKGIRAVLTAENTPAIRIGFLRDNPVLKHGKVRQFRDEVAAVAAVDEDTAREAVDLIRVEYEPLPGVFDAEEALAEGAPLVHETDGRGKPLTGNKLPLVFAHHTGDVDQARKASAHAVEGVFSVPRIQQSCLGTSGALAEFDRRGNLTIWTKTQIPFLAQRDFLGALEAMGLKGRMCRVVVPALGGAFGSGLDTHVYEYVSILLAHRTGKPVKIVYDREEEFACLSPRQGCTVRIEQGCDGAGKLTFRKVHVLQDNGAYASWGATYPSVMLIPGTSLYRVPVVSFDSDIVYTNNTYCQAMRGYGNPEMTWAVESNLDALAGDAGIDPLEMRRINSNRPGDTTPMGLEITSCALAECLDSAGKKIGWTEKRGQGKRRKRGVGVASLIHVGGGGRIYRSDGSGIILRLDDFGNVYVNYGGVEMGQGLHAALTLGVAEAVGVKPDRVLVNPTDTATCPWDVGTHASRGTFMALNAAVRAAGKAREKVFAFAREAFPKEVAKNLKKLRKKDPSYSAPDFDEAKASAEGRFVLEDGVLALEGAPDDPVYRVELGRMLRGMHFRQGGDMLTVEDFYDPPTVLPDWEKGYGNMSAAYAFGTQGAEVEVDEETGEVKILKMVSIHDVGRVIHLQALKGQTYGALAQGVGYALLEEVVSRDGRILNAGFTDYKIPTAPELAFPVEVEFIETDDPSGPFGAKGVGEPGLVPTAPAIANAIFDAVGVRIRDLPITPEKVLAALKAQKR